jgi:hypothetical protein
MMKMDLISYLFRLDSYRLSKVEKLLLETKLFTFIHKELLESFKCPYRDYLRLIKYDDQEEIMSYTNLTQEMIKDILSTGDYSLTGIATHTHIPEEVLLDIASGMNTNPTFELSRKLFDLHVTVRRNLYDKVVEKIILEYLTKHEKVVANKIRS